MGEVTWPSPGWCRRGASGNLRLLGQHPLRGNAGVGGAQKRQPHNSRLKIFNFVLKRLQSRLPSRHITLAPQQ